MLYGFYEYIASGKAAIMLYQFETDSVKRVPEEDQYTYNLYAKKILLDHNTKGRMNPRKINLTSRQLENWSANNTTDITKVALKNIFSPATSKLL